jgi:hypothetical protein
VSCAICGRAARGFAFTPRWSPDRESHAACSVRCLNILSVEGRNVFNLNFYETQAIDAASDRAGAYLDELGKTDLATMTSDEWRTLLTTVFVTATAKIQRLSEENAVPF